MGKFTQFVREHMHGSVLRKYLSHTHIQERRHVFVRNQATNHKDNVVGARSAQLLENSTDEGHVSTRKQTDANDIHVLFNSSPNYFLGPAVKSRIDDLHSRITQ